MATGLKIRRPNLFVVGAPRCGTTSMYKYLQTHPDVFMAPVKEPNFFGSDLRDPKATRDEASYLSLFEAAGDEKYVGEASVWYLYSQRAAQEIHAFAPDARIIAMLRNPVDTMLSLHSHHVLTRYQPVKDFETALRSQGKKKDCDALNAGRSFRFDVSYREAVRFGTQLERFLHCFGPERVHVILLDDVLRDTAAVCRRALRFLDLDASRRPPLKKHNPMRKVRSEAFRRGYDVLFNDIMARRLRIPRPMTSVLRKAVHRLNLAETKQTVPAETRALLLHEMKDEIDKLGDLTGRDLSHWTKPV